MSNTSAAKEGIFNGSEYPSSVTKAFDRAAENYDKYARIQEESAKRLIVSLKPWTDILPPGPVLEIGCGTGFVTERLVRLLPGRELLITDLAPDMVRMCRQKIGANNDIEFRTVDAENDNLPEKQYSLIIGGFVAQWFRHPALTLGKLLKSLQPGGLLLVSFPGNRSFPEWKFYCRELGIPFTGNNLPATQNTVNHLSGGPFKVDYYEDEVVQKFDRAIDFFRNLKIVGAGYQKKGRSLSLSEITMLMKHWNSHSTGKITVTYHTVFVAVKRDSE